MITGAVIPTYRHTESLERVVDAVRAHGLPVIIVDDGNDAAAAQAIQDIAARLEDVTVQVRGENGGKGAAMKDGFRAAARAGWSHALQIDADGQHDVGELAAMLDLARQHPQRVICAVPVYDESIPKSRKIGREITHFWVRVETLSLEINDSMCGFRMFFVTRNLSLQDVTVVITMLGIALRLNKNSRLMNVRVSKKLSQKYDM